MVTQKPDLDQMSETRISRNEHTHTVVHKHDKTHFLLEMLGLFTWYNPVWMILVIFVT